MSTQGTKRSIANPLSAVTAEVTPERERPRRTGEGVGVFRALLITVLIYAACGFLLWYAWHVFRHWRAH